MPCLLYSSSFFKHNANHFLNKHGCTNIRKTCQMVSNDSDNFYQAYKHIDMSSKEQLCGSLPILWQFHILFQQWNKDQNLKCIACIASIFSKMKAIYKDNIFLSHINNLPKIWLKSSYMIFASMLLYQTSVSALPAQFKYFYVKLGIFEVWNDHKLKS